MRISSPNVRPKRRALRRATTGAIAMSPRYESPELSEAEINASPSLRDRRIAVFLLRPIRWKRQHVRRSRFAAIRAIPARHFGVRDQADGNGFGGQAKGTTSAHEEFSQVSRGNADIALAIHDHETRCCALIDGVPIGSMGHGDVRAARDVIANSIAPHLPRAFFAARALGFDRAAGACLCAA